MKRYVALLTLALLAACTPAMKEAGFEPLVGAEHINISVKQTLTPNVYDFSCDLRGAELAWDLGNGTKVKGPKVQGSYPFKGEYTVVLTTLQQGGIVTKRITINVEQDNYELVKDPLYIMLSGGIDAELGKTWMIDKMSKGHLGCGEPGGTSPNWWSASPMEKDDFDIYDDEITFILKGARFDYINSGKTYVNADAIGEAKARGAVVVNEQGDAVMAYEPNTTDWSWSLAKEDGRNYLIFPQNQGFAIYWTQEAHKYEILEIDENQLYLRTELANITWYVRLVRKGFERPSEPEVPKVPEAHKLSETFEGGLIVPFETQQMGALTSFSYSNPAPVPVNTSSRVMLYHKDAEFYGNVFFQAPYKFDLNQINRVKVKVYIPSYNDYTSENTVAGDWIANSKLQPQLAVKLQNGDLGGEAWSSQVEIIKNNLEFNKWVELEFDFSGSAGRADFDRIVLQFGAEGQSGSGIFFLDDFRFEAAGGATQAEYKLVWSDEFEGTSLSSSWMLEQGYIANNELQNYQKSGNHEVSGGTLKITAKKVNDEQKYGSYTSARMTTYGNREFTYGRIEARAKLPMGRGTWPAFWMLGSSLFSGTDWPMCGEIDIMEYVGYNPGSIRGSIHCEAFNGANSKSGDKLIVNENDWHIYGITWDEQKIEFYLDDPKNVFFTYNPANKTAANYPFNKPNFLILNLAIGGDWGGLQGVDNSIFPCTMEVDYVRVYQLK